MHPLVSVIMPVYNGEKYLAEAIESVLAQTMGNWELIIVNDGSSDGSGDIIRKYIGRDHRITLVEQVNQGQSKARNVGAERAQAGYLAFLDQDDVYWPTKLEKQVAILERKKDIGMAYSDIDYLDKDGYVFSRCAIGPGPSPHPKKTIIDCLAHDMFIVPGSVLIRKQVFNRAGGFDIRLSGYEDDDLFLRVYRTSRMIFMRESLLQWRISGDSCSYTDRMRTSRLTYFKKLKEMFPDNPRQNLYWARDVLVPRFSGILFAEMMSARRRGDFRMLGGLRQDFTHITPRSLKMRLAPLLFSRWIPLQVLNFFRTLHRLYR